MVQPGTDGIWLWLGAALMALGALWFVALGWNETDSERQRFFVVTIFVPVIAALAYFAMATGVGSFELQVPWQTAPLSVYWARYADWMLTTPLLLLDLALLAGADRNTIGTLIGLDVGMVATGFVATVTTASPAYRIAWWGISSGFFLVLLYVLVSRLSAQAATQPGAVGALFARLRNLTILLWTAYPVVWLVGTEGVSLIPLYWETAAFMVLDVSAKVGFGYLLLHSRHTLGQVALETPEAATTAD